MTQFSLLKKCINRNYRSFKIDGFWTKKKKKRIFENNCAAAIYARSITIIILTLQSSHPVAGEIFPLRSNSSGKLSCSLAVSTVIYSEYVNVYAYLCICKKKLQLNSGRVRKLLKEFDGFNRCKPFYPQMECGSPFPYRAIPSGLFSDFFFVFVCLDLSV